LQVEITIGRLLRMVWLMAWSGLIGAVVIGAVTGFIMGAFGSTREQVVLVTSITEATAGSIWWVVVFRMALQKQYKDFRVALIVC
jgi:hypothetical protein